MIFDIIRLFHIAFAAFWLASTVKEIFAPLELTGNRTADRTRIVRREKVAGMLGTISGMGTIISGSILLWMIGFGGNPWALELGMTIAVVMGCVGAFGNGGSYKKIIGLLQQEVDDVMVLPLLDRHRRVNMVMLALWLVTFALMGMRHAF